MDYKSAVSLLLFLTATLQVFECAPQAPNANVQGIVENHNHTTTISPNTTVTPTTPTTTTTKTTTSSTTPVTPPSSSTAPNSTTTHPSTPTTITTSTATPPTTIPSSSKAPPTTAPTTTIKPTPSPTPKPDDRSFDFPSFMGGAILTLGLISISYVVIKYYKSRSDAYRTL